MVSPFVCDTCTLTNGFHESTNANQCVVSPVDPISVMNLPHEDIIVLCWRSPLQNYKLLKYQQPLLIVLESPIGHQNHLFEPKTMSYQLSLVCTPSLIMFYMIIYPLIIKTLFKLFHPWLNHNLLKKLPKVKDGPWQCSKKSIL